MAQLKALADIANNAQLLSVLQVAVRRAAIAIIANPQASADEKSWAKRAHYEAVSKAPWYASRILEGALWENAQVRDALYAAYQAGQQEVQIDDAVLIALVNTWVGRFVANYI